MKFEEIEEKLEKCENEIELDNFDAHWNQIKDEFPFEKVKRRSFKKFTPLISAACAIVVALSIIIPLTVNRKPSALSDANGFTGDTTEEESSQTYFASDLGAFAVTEEEFYNICSEKWENIIDFKKFDCESWVMLKPENEDIFVGGIVGAYDDIENITYMFDVSFYDERVYVSEFLTMGYTDNKFINGANIRYKLFNDYGDGADYKICAQKDKFIYIINCTTVGYDIDGFLNYFFA